MRLLDRYLLRELCVPLIYCLAGFLIFWVSFDLFGDLEDFQNAGLGAADVAQYYLVKTPELLVTVLPVALLLALLYALTNHARHNEMVAMRAAGLSLARISVPYLVVGFVLSAGLFYLNEQLFPDSVERATAIKKGRKENTDSNVWRQRVNFRNASENRIWNISAFNTVTYQLVEPHVEWRLPDGTKKQIIARSGGRTNDQWIFYDVELYTYAPGMDFDRPGNRPLRTNQLIFAELTEKPQDIQLQIKFQRMNAIEAAKRAQLSLAEINYLRRHLELNARDRAMLETQFHTRIAQNWTCFVVALLALPFAANTNSRRNVLVGVASSIFIVFVYFVLLRIGLALGTGGYIPPWLAAWLPNAFFASLGLWLTWKIK
jgi:lipopolysaccharide export system permease protein